MQPFKSMAWHLIDKAGSPLVKLSHAVVVCWQLPGINSDTRCPVGQTHHTMFWVDLICAPPLHELWASDATVILKKRQSYSPTEEDLKYNSLKHHSPYIPQTLSRSPSVAANSQALTQLPASKRVLPAVCDVEEPVLVLVLIVYG